MIFSKIAEEITVLATNAVNVSVIYFPLALNSAKAFELLVRGNNSK
jgi:hypothetical protein